MTKRRICIFGSSHIAAVRLGLKKREEAGIATKGIQLDILGSRDSTLNFCRIENGVLYPENEIFKETLEWTSGGKSKIEFRQYDEIYFLAGVSPFEVSLYGANGKFPPLGRSTIKAIIDNWVEDWPCTLANKIARAAPDASVFFLGKPFPAETSPGSQSFRKEQKLDAGMMQRIADVQAEILTHIKDLDLALTNILKPPASCLDEYGLFTQERFTRDSVRLLPGASEKHPIDDFEHMNGSYGEEILKAYIFGS